MASRTFGATPAVLSLAKCMLSAPKGSIRMNRETNALKDS
jgi:hypothetical protein